MSGLCWAINTDENAPVMVSGKGFVSIGSSEALSLFQKWGFVTFKFIQNIKRELHFIQIWRSTQKYTKTLFFLIETENL